MIFIQTNSVTDFLNSFSNEAFLLLLSLWIIFICKVFQTVAHFYLDIVFDSLDFVLDIFLDIVFDFVLGFVLDFVLGFVLGFVLVVSLDIVLDFGLDDVFNFDLLCFDLLGFGFFDFDIPDFDSWYFGMLDFGFDNPYSDACFFLHIFSVMFYIANHLDICCVDI